MKTLNKEKIIFKSFEVKEETIVDVSDQKFVFIDGIYFKALEALETDYSSYDWDPFFGDEIVGLLRLYNVGLEKIESFNVFSRPMENSNTPGFYFLLDIEEIDFLELFNIDIKKAMAEHAKQPVANTIGYVNETEQSTTYFSSFNEVIPATFNFCTEKVDGRFTFYLHHDVLPEQVKFDRQGNVTLTCNLFKNSYTVEKPMFPTLVFYKTMSVPVQQNINGTLDISLEIDGKKTVTFDDLKEIPLIKETLIDLEGIKLNL